MDELVQEVVQTEPNKIELKRHFELKPGDTFTNDGEVIAEVKAATD